MSRRTQRLRLRPALVFFGLTGALFAQYSGPAILSRGEAPAAMSAPNIRFQPFVELSGMYDSGLANVGITDQGQLADSSAVGIGLTWGLSGTHSWRRDKVGVSYRGGLTHYGKHTGYDSIDQSLLLSWNHQFSPHMSLDFHESAAIVSRDFGLLNLPSTVSFDPSTSFIPTTDFFDNRTYYLNTHASFVYQRTARLSFNLGGDKIEIRRRSNALEGVRGYTATGDVQYRLNRRSTIGANYTYLKFGYTRVSGGTDVHGVAATYALRVSRWLEFSGYGGIMRVESKFNQALAIDPAIAALLGITSTAQIVHTISYTPNVGGRLSRTFHTGVLYVSGQHGVTPGNGLFTTSYTSDVAGGYSYTGLRRWSFGATADYMWADAVGTIRGNYTGLGAGVTASRQIIRSVHLTSGFQARKYGSSDFAKYNRTIYEVRVGVGFAPGDIPLRIW